MSVIRLPIQVETHGHTAHEQFMLEDGQNVMRCFHGRYTINEVAALLDEMRTVQAQIDAWRKDKG